MTQLPLQLIRLCIIRTVLITVLLVLSLFLELHLGIELPHGPLGLVLLAGLGLNALTLWRVQHRSAPSDQIFCLQLLLDIAWLGSYLYLAGGVSNPLISSFLIPVALAAIALPRRMSTLVLLVSVIAYSLLMHYFLPLHTPGAHAGSLINLHLWGMWGNYLLSAGLISIFIGQIARSLRQFEAERAALRENQLRNEQLIGIALQAAGTAHELGTPLNSAQLICEDLIDSAGQYPELQDDLRALSRQLERCRTSLHQLSRRCQPAPGDRPAQLPAHALMARLADHWQLLHPDIPLHLTGTAEGRVCHDLSLEQALINLLSNAADVSPDGIDISIRAQEHWLLIELHDQGPGVDASVADELGEPFVSSKRQGLGLGWYLSQATLERFGGRVSLHNRAQGGTLTLIELPLSDHD